MKNPFKRGEPKPRATLVLDPRSWHVKIYNYWKAHSILGLKHGSSYRENLCHYWRVVLIWGPWTWWCTKNVVRGLTPGTLLLIASTITAYVSTWVFATSVALGITIGLVGAGLGIGFLYLCHRNSDAIADFCDRHLLPRLNRLGDRLARVPWAAIVLVLMIGLSLTGLTLLAIFETMNLLLALALLVGIGLLAVAIVALIEFVLKPFGKKLARRHRAAVRERAPREREAKGPGFLHVTARLLIAKKHRICPFIDFKS